jgi:hypothetical protein
MIETKPTAPSSYTAPTPEVHHLQTLFRRLSQGEIRVPAFQRGFVWSEQKVLGLFDSVFRGYPIGSVLLWRVDGEVFRKDSFAKLPFPTTSSGSSSQYVLDGMQRLASLYGAFHFDGTQDPIFNVVYNLKEERFSLKADAPSGEPHVPMSSLFSPKEFLRLTSTLNETEGGDKWIDKALELQRVFQEYLIPTVTISNRDPQQVVEVFQRINSTGVGLSAVDFIRALLWKDDFDLNVELEKLQRQLEDDTSVALEAETLAKSLAVALGKDPTAQSMFTLGTLPSEELRQGLNQAESALREALNYLAQNFFIRSEELIPYEGQLFVAMKLFSSSGGRKAAATNYFWKWFLASTLDESLRGKPDHITARIVREFELLSELEIEPTISLALTPEVLAGRRLIRGKSLTIGLLILFALRGARDIVSGKVVSPAEFLSGFGSDSVGSILHSLIVSDVLNRSMTSSRVASNVVVGANDVKTRGAIEALLNRAFVHGDEDARAIAESQFLTQTAAAAYLREDYRTFLLERSTAMVAFAKSLLGVQG